MEEGFQMVGGINLGTAHWSNAHSLSTDIQDLVLSLGNPLPSEESSNGQPSTPGEYMNDIVCFSS